MKLENADILYESKIDWTAVYSDNKIYCTERRCDFYTNINNEDLTEHLIQRHNYGQYPCDHPHCNYVGYSKVSLIKIIVYKLYGLE